MRQKRQGQKKSPRQKHKRRDKYVNFLGQPSDLVGYAFCELLLETQLV